MVDAIIVEAGKDRPSEGIERVRAVPGIEHLEFIVFWLLLFSATTVQCDTSLDFVFEGEQNVIPIDGCQVRSASERERVGAL